MAKKGSSDHGAEQLITKDHVHELAKKLEDWSATLPPAEQALLNLILNRAKSTASVATMEAFTSGTAAASTASSAAVGLSAAQTRTWLTPWVLNRNLSFAATSVNEVAFAKDTGPSWVNSPRRV
jgi:hypothetical protein